MKKYLNQATMMMVVAIILIIVSGILLSNQGRPYNQILFNLHKFIVLLTIIYMIVYFKNTIKVSLKSLKASVIVHFMIGLISLLILVITGGLLSENLFDQDLLLVLHQISPFIFTYTLAYIIYHLKENKHLS